MPDLCGAKTRSGKPCKARPMGNGRCRMHGGKSTGAGDPARPGNTNAVTHGGYRSVLRDALSDEDRAVFDAMPTEADDALDDTLRALGLREYRVLRWLLGNAGETGALDAVSGAHDALTRITNAKLRAIEAKLRADSGGSNTDGLRAFLAAFDHMDADVDAARS